jgi:hypothetical protein
MHKMIERIPYWYNRLKEELSGVISCDEAAVIGALAVGVLDVIKSVLVCFLCRHQAPQEIRKDVVMQYESNMLAPKRQVERLCTIPP